MSASLFCPRCATPNVADASVCRSCGSALPRRVEAYVPRGPAPDRDLVAVDSRLLVEKAKVKSPGLAGVLGFLIPFLGAFYNGKVVLGFVLLGFEILFDSLSLVTAGVPAVAY